MRRQEMYVTKCGKAFIEERDAIEEQQREDLEESVTAVLVKGHVSEHRAKIIGHALAFNPITRIQLFQVLREFYEKESNAAF